MKLYIKVLGPADRVEIQYFGKNDWRVVRYKNNREQYRYLVNSEEEAIAYYHKMN